MSSRSTARQHRALAQEQYKRGQYLEVMQSADKALALGYLDLSVYDIKAAALNKLVEPQDGPWRDLGFETIKLMCQKWPNHWRPYYRRAEHLRSRKSYIHALAAIEKALEFVDSENRGLVQRKQTEIQGQREVFLIEQERKISRASKEERTVLVQKRRIEANRTKDFTHLLSPDILDMIVDHLMVDNPSIACRIASVRRTWRDWMLERKGVWQNLVLSSRRPVEKTKVFLERSGGSLRKLKIRESINDNQEQAVAEILDGHVGKVKSITFSRRPAELLRLLEGQFDAIEELSLTPNILYPIDTRDPYRLARERYQSLDLGVQPRKPTLRHISIGGSRVRLVNRPSQSSQGGNVGGNAPDLSLPLPQLVNVETLKLNHVFMTCLGNSLVVIARHLPNLVHLTLDQVVFRDEGSGQGDVVLDRLVTFSIPGLHVLFDAPRISVIVDFFTHVTTPNLLHLDLWKWSGRDLASLWPAPGLSPALSTLLSLDIGKMLFDEGALLNALKQMPSLRFLNVSYTPLGDNFLEAITRDRKATADEESDQEELLPNLIALSIAGLEITSLSLRDFTVSRLPKASKSQTLRQKQVTKGTAFRPASSTASRNSSTSATQVTGSKQRPSAAAQNSSRVKSSPTSFRPYLKWLCLDGCDKIDSQLTDYLRTKISFVSSGAQLNEDRVRAKGKYDWKLDYYDSCATSDPEIKCYLVAVPGTRDSYEIQHTCGKHNYVPEPEELDQENIWESQWNPSSSQDGDAEEMFSVKAGKGKGKEDVSTATPAQSQKRQLSSDASGRSRTVKAKISIGPDGSLSGF